MAEVVGLVIGGISLAAIFDQCITIIKDVDASRQYSDDYPDAALMLTPIGERLNRWERTIRDSPDFQATEEDGENAELLLKQIRKRLEEAEKLGQHYSFTVEPTKKSVEMSHIVEKVQTMVLHTNGGLSTARKAHWASIDQEKMRTLIEKLDMLVSKLEKLFPSLQEPRTEMLRGDVAGLLKPTRIGESPQAVRAPKAAVAKFDKDFEVIALSPSSHIYRNIENTDGALVNAGDYVSTDFANADTAALRGGNHTYEGVRSSGKSVVNIGNMYGKSVFELQRG